MSEKTFPPDILPNYRKLKFVRFVIENIIGYDEEILRPILKMINLNPQGIEDCNTYADKLKKNMGRSDAAIEIMALLCVLLENRCYSSGIAWDKTDFSPIFKEIDIILSTRKRTIPWPFDDTLNDILKELKLDATKKEPLSDEEMARLLQKPPSQGVYQFDIWVLGPFGLTEARGSRWFIPQPLCKDPERKTKGLRTEPHWAKYKFYGCPSPRHCDVKDFLDILTPKRIPNRLPSGLTTFPIVPPGTRERMTKAGILPPDAITDDTVYEEAPKLISWEPVDLDTALESIGYYPSMVSFLGYVFTRENLATIFSKVFKQNEGFYKKKFFGEKIRFQEVIADKNLEDNLWELSKPKLLQLLCWVSNDDIVKAIDTWRFEEDKERMDRFIVMDRDITFSCENENEDSLKRYCLFKYDTPLKSGLPYKLGLGPYGMLKVPATAQLPPQLLLSHLIAKGFTLAGQIEDIKPYIKKYNANTIEEGVLCWILEKGVDHILTNIERRYTVLKEVLRILRMPQSILNTIDFENKERTTKLLNWILNKVGLFPPLKIDGLNNYEHLVSETLKYIEDKKALSSELRGKLHEVFKASEKILKDTIMFNSYMFLHPDEFGDYLVISEYWGYHDEPIAGLLDVQTKVQCMIIKENFEGRPINGGTFKIDTIEKWDLGTIYFIVEFFPSVIKERSRLSEDSDEEKLLNELSRIYEGFSLKQECLFKEFNKQLQASGLKDIRNALSHDRNDPLLEKIREMLIRLQEVAEFLRKNNLYPRLAHYKGCRLDMHGLRKLIFEDEYEKPFEVFMQLADESLFNPFEAYGFKTFTETEVVINPIIIKIAPVLELE